MTQSDQTKTLHLQAKVGRRVQRGHLWVFSNEVASVQGDPRPGDEVAVLDHKRHFLGMALYSQSSLIRARIYSRQWGELCDGPFIARRLREAMEFRRAAGWLGSSYRLCHGEGDGLPGLVVDVLGGHALVQIGTAAMDVRRELIVEALRELLSPVAVIERSDLPLRALEGLAETTGVLWGEPQTPARVEENGVTVLADLMGGQKTGYFLDQVKNRTLAAPFFAGREVLDLFCYVGGWSLVAARHGSARVTAVDSSRPALEMGEQSARFNNFPEDKIQWVQADAFAFLREMTSTQQRYGVVIVDPPALAKNRKDMENALRAYRELNLRAMQLLAPGGLLISCSCSHHVPWPEFTEMLTLAARDAKCDFSLVHQSTQSPDHPIHLATPETSYLKAMFLMKREF